MQNIENKGHNENNKGSKSNGQGNTGENTGQLEMPKRYSPKESEEKWISYWIKNRVYSFDPDSDKEVFSIDTPPPTVSGKMHLGHAFSYTQEDFIARFQRMLGKNVFYPFGTDDNGIATERLIEMLKGVKAAKMDRKEFSKLCLDTLKDIRKEYIKDWKRIGVSCDWDIFYSTLDEHSKRISQRSFIELYKKGREYRKEAPFIWCPSCQTAISQVETKDVELDSYFNDIIFKVEGEDDIIISTTRPEFLPATVAVFFHPDDERYKKYLGKKAKVPLFDFEVPIMVDNTCDPEKGTGIMMVCTFGDQEDVDKWFRYGLELKELITKDGRLTKIAGKYAGMKIKEAREQIIADLDKAGLLVSKKHIKHSVKVHERCDTEIEFINTKQWFIKYLDLKPDMLKWGEELNWYPKHMKVRYDNWVKGLQWDWCISRQRYSGVPFPVWYCKNCGEVILADEDSLPVDPIKDKPGIEKCPKCGSKEFVPETDVMDTWATSSLTPQIAAELFKGKPIYNKLFPMSLRPQAHDIITFWLFNTVVKSRLHNGINPWQDVMISGHAQDPHGRKMSKSKGNVIEPQKMIEKYSADALRFWAAGSKLGDDLPFQEKDLVTGTKFATKLWNAIKFTIMHLRNYDYDLGRPNSFNAIDKWLLSKLNSVIKESTESFLKYEYSKTKQITEKFFWQAFCDNYLEFIKHRLYNPEKYSKDEITSALFTLYNASLSVLKLMAPIMPFITEEIYHLYFNEKEGKKSIHVSEWPKHDEKLIDNKAELIGNLAVYAVTEARKAKSQSNLSLKAPVKKIAVKAKITEEEFNTIVNDIKETANAEMVLFEQIPNKSKEDYFCDLVLN